MLKKTIVYLLSQVSKFIYLLIQKEFKNNKRKKLKLKIKDNLLEETYSNFLVHFKKSVLFEEIWQIREYAIKTSQTNNKDENYFNLEFGVFRGRSTNFFSNYVNKLYGFDSFEGLKEDWAGRGSSRGTFNLNKKIPKLNSNVEVINGWVEDTLDDFLAKHKPKIKFVHFDLDTYSPTKFVLEKIKPYLVKDSIILFDELYNYIGWEHGEYKALKEVFDDKEYIYKAFNIQTENGQQVVIQIK